MKTVLINVQTTPNLLPYHKSVGPSEGEAHHGIITNSNDKKSIPTNERITAERRTTSSPVAAGLQGTYGVGPDIAVHTYVSPTLLPALVVETKRGGGH